MKDLLLQVAERLMSVPAAPYFEAEVRAVAEQICVEHGLVSRRDRFGNLWVAHKKPAKTRPLVFVAHMDHPGFEITHPLGPGRFRAQFNGGVGDSYFKKGVKVRLMPGSIPAILERRIGTKREFELRVKERSDFKAASKPRFAVWELADFKVSGERITGRACDDLIGVATILATIIELKGASVNVAGLLTRAEEVGFHGALAAANAKEFPKNPLIISLETSRELPGVKMGEGVIVRVGDRSSVFDSAGTRFLAETAGILHAKRIGFKSQLALMSGGTCEATAFQEFGFQTAAVCVALGNYHNCAENDRIAAEYVSANDTVTMAQLLAEAARQMRNFDQLTGKLPLRLRELAKQAERRLLKSEGY